MFDTRFPQTEKLCSGTPHFLKFRALGLAFPFTCNYLPPPHPHLLGRATTQEEASSMADYTPSLRPHSSLAVVVRDQPRTTRHASRWAYRGVRSLPAEGSRSRGRGDTRTKHSAHVRTDIVYQVPRSYAGSRVGGRARAATPAQSRRVRATLRVIHLTIAAARTPSAGLKRPLPKLHSLLGRS